MKRNEHPSLNITDPVYLAAIALVTDGMEDYGADISGMIGFLRGQNYMEQVDPGKLADLIEALAKRYVVVDRTTSCE